MRCMDTNLLLQFHSNIMSISHTLLLIGSKHLVTYDTLPLGIMIIPTSVMSISIKTKKNQIFLFFLSSKEVRDSHFVT